MNPSKDAKKNADPDTTLEPSSGPLKNEPTPERAEEEKRAHEEEMEQETKR